MPACSVHDPILTNIDVYNLVSENMIFQSWQLLRLVHYVDIPTFPESFESF